MFNLKDKKIVVTGAAQGNGAALAKGLSQQGAIVILADLNDEKLQQVQADIQAENGTAYCWHLDVSDVKSCQQFAQQVQAEVGDIDVLVNNAGILRRGDLSAENCFQDLDDTLKINVQGSYYLIHSFVDALKRSKGNIVNVASIQAFVAATSATSYAISKGAVAQLTRTLAAELAPQQIRVNAIAPGMIETPNDRVYPCKSYFN